MEFQTYNNDGSLSFNSVQILFGGNDMDIFCKAENINGYFDFINLWWNNEKEGRHNEFYNSRKQLRLLCLNLIANQEK